VLLNLAAHGGNSFLYGFQPQSAIHDDLLKLADRNGMVGSRLSDILKGLDKKPIEESCHIKLPGNIK
jgi:hypothetical protein